MRRLLPEVFLAIALGAAVAAVAQEATKPSKAAESEIVTQYAVLIQGKPAGTQTSSLNADGRRRYHFEFNDRGRGPSLDEKVVLDANGLPTAVETTGNEY